MNILLINTNPVVSRLVSLCMRDESISFEEVDRISEVSGMRYDIVFIDDSSYHDEVAVFLKTIQAGKIVFLSSRDTGDEIGTAFDTVIKKPFLPSQIQAVLDSAEPLEEIAVKESVPEEGDEHFIFPLAASNEKEREDVSDEPLDLLEDLEEINIEEPAEEEESISEEEIELPEPPKVLDGNEVERIKALLDEDDDEELLELDLEDLEEVEARKVEVITQKLEEEGLEIVEEEEIIASLSETPKKKKKKNKKKSKKKQKSEEIYTFEEALLAAVENMKPKKIKKLLKGAEVTIKIRFKDDE
jgi:hypothetical protein